VTERERERAGATRPLGQRPKSCPAVSLTSLSPTPPQQFDPIEFIKGAKDMKPSFSDPKVMDGKDLEAMKGELADLYGLKKNITVVKKLAKKELIAEAEAKLDGLTNKTSGIKEEAEAKVMDVKAEAEEKLEALLNVSRGGRER